ncbi:multidrug transporter subunit MdtD, partial [Salmonella enterica subsp. enterica serovar Infantis]
SAFHACLMIIPMVLWSMGMKRILFQIFNLFGYRRVLLATTLGLSLVSLLFMSFALLGWYFLLPIVLLFVVICKSERFCSLNS